MNDKDIVLNDPVYGFTLIPRGLLAGIVAHPYFQRMGRIRQLGMASLVYPGAQHTRKQHSIGAYHLMRSAFDTLAGKGVFIFDAEREAAEAAILMHDLGHGPYSHVLEGAFVPDAAHEAITLLMMQRMNDEMHGALSLAIKVFRGDYPKRFLHELICSQLDMDRLDYLCRDSFYTGVREGNIGAERIIKMLNVDGDRLVVDAKGIYSVENYLMARRIMYWQVYLHKTAVAAEELLRSTLSRARELAGRGVELFGSPALRFFLYNHVTLADLSAGDGVLDRYAMLDDSDILCALKVWAGHSDRVLAALAGAFVNRRLFKVEAYDEAVPPGRIEELRARVAAQLGVGAEEAAHFVTTRTVEKEMYSTTAEGICLLGKDGTTRDVSAVSHIVTDETAKQTDRKVYLFRPREID